MRSLLKGALNRWWLLPLALMAAATLWATPGFPQDDLRAAVEEIKRELAILKAGQAKASGGAIYRVACSGCHGINGDGSAPAAVGFEFRATDLRKAVYKFRSTIIDALPTDGDLQRSIRQGVPGTEMVPFNRLLSEEEIASLAQYIKSFAKSFDAPPSDEIIAIPEERLVARTDATVAAGREIYRREECNSCHGDNGGGDGPDAEGITDEDDYPLRMFDFADGVFKSGASDQDLFRTISTGMNGTPMEGYHEDTSEEERWQLIDYIRSLEKTRGGFAALWHYFLVEDPSGMDYRVK